ncbi:MAG: hypothetical protein JOY71_19970 [Acetobacteraceae bacterium]|nr:hypothetical protein [Acetobacteraceae bacterium]
MKVVTRLLLLTTILVAGAVASPRQAQAWWRYGFGVVVAPPVVVGPPVYVAPPPVAYPPPVYYGPPRPLHWVPGHWSGPYWIPGHWA